MSHAMSQKMAGQLTLRGIPADLFRQLKAEARRLGISINRVILARILPHAAKRREGAAAGLLSMGRTWDKARTDDFEKQLEGHRRIDPELWS